MFWKRKPPPPPKKTVEDVMKELVVHERFHKVPALQVDWLKDAEWQFTPQGLCVSEALWSHVSRLYQGARSLENQTVVSAVELKNLKKENEKLKTENARLKKELESIAPKPLGRKIVTDTEKTEVQS